MAGPNVRAILQNVVVPEIRGSAFAVYALTDDLGKGFGPSIIVQLIKSCTGNRKMAFQLVTAFWVACAMLQLTVGILI